MKNILHILLLVFTCNVFLMADIINPYKETGSNTNVAIDYIYIEDTIKSSCVVDFPNLTTWFQEHTNIAKISSTLTISPDGYCAHKVSFVYFMSCENNTTWNEGSLSCEPPSCPLNSSRVDAESECVCNSPYYPSYDITNNFTCILPDCPKFYEEHNPPLPLFMQTDTVNKCNFATSTDGALLDLDGLVCCYGLEDDLNKSICPLKTIEINGACYPIAPIEQNGTDTTCPAGEYYSFEANECVSFYPDNDNNATPPNSNTNGDQSNNSGDNNDNNSTSSNSNNGGDSNGSYIPPTYDEGSGISDSLLKKAMSTDLVKSKLGSIINGYVLINLPVKVSGTCSSEVVKTFTIFGKSYTLDLRKHIASIMSYAPTIKMIILFMSAISGILIVLGRAE